MVYRRR